jgi:4-amino-4-deoxy-L-arabinose transferase-like glycosyltransferase
MTALPPVTTGRAPAWARGALFVVITAGTLLRFAGLSHDLHEGHLYHPDTPKQIRAAERYLDGRYYFYIGHSDYDGYPYFTSHLVEWTVRAGQPIVRGARALLGLPVDAGQPASRDLYWIFRFLNATLASLLVWLLYRGVRREWGEGAGLLAALLLAVSPADVAACHYEAGDTPASFFATLAVLAALRVYRDGRAGSIIAGTFLAVCAFAAKYHGALAGLAVALAFALRQPGRWGWIATRAAWRGWGLMAAVAVVSVFVTIPALFLHPVRMVEHIHGFLTYASAFHLPKAVEEGGALAKLIYSLRQNLPELLAMLSGPAALAGLFAFGLAVRRDRRVLLLAVLPLTYIFVALGLRPQSHPVYHTLTLPILFAAAAVGLIALARVGNGRAPRWLATLAGLASVGLLAQAALREAFFFQQPDTRRLAQAWTAENVPARFAVSSGPYTFRPPGFAEAHTNAAARLWITSSIRSPGPPAAGFPFQQFQLERESLPLFRNPVLDLYVAAPGLIRPGFRLPVFQAVPSRTGNPLVFEPGGGLVRDGRSVDLAPRTALDLRFIRTAPAASALAVVRAGATPATVRLELGGHRRDATLGPGEVDVFAFERPATAWPRPDARVMYRARALASSGRARVTWAFTDAEQGVALWQAGEFAAAAPCLVRASDQDPAHPTLAVLARLSVGYAETLAPPETLARLDARCRAFVADWDAARVYTVFGLAPAYLDELPYMAWTADQLRGDGLRGVAEEPAAFGDEPAPPALGETTNWSLRTPAFSLPPGQYLAAVEVVSGARGTQALDAVVLDAAGRPQQQVAVSAAAGRQVLQIPFALAEELVDGRLALQGDGGGLRVEGLRIRPDSVATLNQLGDAWRVLAGQARPSDAAAPATYRAWLARGRAAAAAGRGSDAVADLARARALGPERVEAVRALASLPASAEAPLSRVVADAQAQWAAVSAAQERVSTDVRFGRELRLDGFRLGARVVSAGGELGLNLDWLPLRPGVRPHGLSAWVHVLDEQNHTAFQADRDVMSEWNRARTVTALQPPLHLTPVPATVKPGRYRIVVGLYTPETGRRLPVRAAGLTEHDDGVVLPVDLLVR